MDNQTSIIPNSWRITKLGNQIRVGRGSSPRPIQDFISDHGIPWVKIADASASETRYIVKTKECIKEEGRSTSVKIGDLIVSNSATPGIPKFLGIDACVHDGWLVFADYKDLDKLYLYYFFLDYRRTLEHSASGTVFVNLQTEIVRNIEMNLPPIAEQQAIAKVLSSLDDKIELLREQNKTLEATD
ncbi:MAG: restriction endonuclease subunit S, partial [Candidatus Woesebacteria bacterium]|nr:restriction endonuclease subunit S [Candidatus Woesebacteria bacterium]